MWNRGVVALVLLPLLAACGGSDGDDDPTLAVPSTVEPTGPAVPSDEPDFTSGDNAPDPCSLLSTAEVSTAVGAPVQAGEKTVNGPPLGGESCLWATDGVPVRTFQVALKDGGDITVSGLDPATLYDQTVRSFPGLTDTPGLGDRAAVGASTAFVLANGIFVSTSVAFGSSDTAKAALLSLTTKAVAGL